MKDWKICKMYSDISDKVTSVIFAKRIAEEERKRKLTVLIVTISVAVTVAAAIAAAVVYLASKTEEGERRGKLLVEKIKSKLPRRSECCTEEDCFECDECCECEVVEETVEE